MWDARLSSRCHFLHHNNARCQRLSQYKYKAERGEERRGEVSGTIALSTLACREREVRSRASSAFRVAWNGHPDNYFYSLIFLLARAKSLSNDHKIMRTTQNLPNPFWRRYSTLLKVTLTVVSWHPIPALILHSSSSHHYHRRTVCFLRTWNYCRAISPAPRSIRPSSSSDTNLHTLNDSSSSMTDETKSPIPCGENLDAATAVADASTNANNDDNTTTDDIPSFNGDEKSKASDFANYFCSYAQLYHQKQMLQDHARMAAYHAAIRGNADVFRDKVVLDIGTGSGILAVWAAQAGARKVYAIEYTNMAKHAQQVVDANHVQHIVTVLQCAVEDLVLPVEADGLTVEESDDTEGDENLRCVDIIISEWMGYFLLRESMLDSIVRARDKFLKRSTGLLFPSHCTMYVAPIADESERKVQQQEYHAALDDWQDFCRTTAQVYGVNMSVLTPHHEREQKEYYLLSSRWTELPPNAVLADPVAIKHLDMMTCTIADARGIGPGEATFDFTMFGDSKQFKGKNSRNNGGLNDEDEDANNEEEDVLTVSGMTGWFTADFRSRSDAMGAVTAPTLQHPAFLSTGPENGYTHWGQQTFYFVSPVLVPPNTSVQLKGALELLRTKENARLYNCRLAYQTTTTKQLPSANRDEGSMEESIVGEMVNQVYQIP